MTGGRAQLLIASNRGPVSFSVAGDGTLGVRRGDGGLVTGLAAAGRDDDTVWVCAALSDGDRAAAAEAPDGRVDLAGHDTGGRAVRMLDIDPAVRFAAYNKVANRALWFLHHELTPMGDFPRDDPDFRREWASYRTYNRLFAEALADEAAPGAKVIVQDYHLSLAPVMLRALRPDLRIGHFTHTPWAPASRFRTLPGDIARQLIRGLLGADHAGFHTTRWARAFLDSSANVLGAQVDRQAMTVTYGDRTTHIGVHPIGIDAELLRQQASSPETQAYADHLRAIVGGRKVIVRVDRVDPSKNLARGLMAYRRLLDEHPEWRGNVMLATLMVPSRQDVPEYRGYTALIKRLAWEIHRDYGTDTWMPIIVHEGENLPLALAAYLRADVGLVNVGRDGMNLVAKEMPVVSEDGIALVLSKEAGAFAELGPYAVPVSPLDVEETAEALHTALSMSAAERRERTAHLAAAAAAHPPARWLAEQVDALGAPTPAPDPAGADTGQGLAAPEHARATDPPTDQPEVARDTPRDGITPKELGAPWVSTADPRPRRSASHARDTTPPVGPSREHRHDATPSGNDHPSEKHHEIGGPGAGLGL